MPWWQTKEADQLPALRRHYTYRVEAAVQRVPASPHLIFIRLAFTMSDCNQTTMLPCTIEIVQLDGDCVEVKITPREQTWRIGLAPNIKTEDHTWEAIETNQLGRVVQITQLHLAGKDARFIQCDYNVWEPCFWTNKECFQLDRVQAGTKARLHIDPITGEAINAKTGARIKLYSDPEGETDSETDSGCSADSGKSSEPSASGLTRSNSV